MVSAADLKPYDRNSRTHSRDQVALIARSIEEFGFTQPILCDENNLILAGHGRLAAAKRLKIDLVPVVHLVGLSEAQKRAYVLADNKIAEQAGWDEELLGDELKWLQDAGFDMELTGFSDSELEKLIGELGNVTSTPGGDESGQLQSVYEILIDCKDEAHQLELLKRFETEGIQCRALVS